MRANDVQCVPGGHRVPLDKRVYWCPECEFYICYDHLKSGFWTTDVKCPEGHRVRQVTRR